MSSVYINGQFRTADNTEPVLEAATGELLGQGASATTGDVDEAVAAARAALPGWRSTRRSSAKILSAFADDAQRRAHSTEELVTRDGMRSVVSGPTAPSPLALFALRAPDPHDTAGRSSPEHGLGTHGRFAARPWAWSRLWCRGIIRALAASVRAALAAGCTVVLKAAVETALMPRLR